MDLLPGPGGQDIRMILGDPSDNPFNLSDGLSLAVDYFRHACPETPVVVDLGIAQVVNRQLFQNLNGRIHVSPAGFDGLKQISQGLRIHAIALLSMLFQVRIQPL
jgi:hypothetical protein